MQINLLAPCSGNTCSVLAAVAVIFFDVVLRDELETVNIYVNAHPREKALGVRFCCK